MDGQPQPDQNQNQEPVSSPPEGGAVVSQPEPEAAIGKAVVSVHKRYYKKPFLLLVLLLALAAGGYYYWQNR